MAYEKFKNVNLRADSLERVDQCNKIIEDYQSQGLKLTLRQLYYQLVTKNAIVNSERSYQNLSKLVSDARLSGLMDWDAIEDRVRRPRIPAQFKNLKDLVEAALWSYRLPRWKGQERYVELWVEKDALAGVLQPLASKYHVTMMVNRGYSSQSAMYEAAERFRQRQNLDCTLLYLGDHDPSGEDMVRDIQERLQMFAVAVVVKKIALTYGQVQYYNPPPNPAKVSDPRAEAYIAKHGPVSWEVDALPPNVLTKIIETEIQKLVDKDAMDEVISQEKIDKQKLREAAKKIVGDDDDDDGSSNDEPEDEE